MQPETDLIERQHRRRRIQTLILALPWCCLALAVIASLWAIPK